MTPCRHSHSLIPRSLHVLKIARRIQFSGKCRAIDFFGGRGIKHGSRITESQTLKKGIKRGKGIRGIIKTVFLNGALPYIYNYSPNSPKCNVLEGRYLW